MKKTGIRDVKKQNMKCILNEFIGAESLSRIELAKRTGLAPSTVTALTSELLDSKLLVMSGEKIHTAGRSRSGLALNRDYAFSIVFDISRNKVAYSVIDMSLTIIDQGILTDKYVSGNDLFCLLCTAVQEKLRDRKLAGIGLVYIDSSMHSDFSVLYSAGLVSEYISLKNALITAFKVNVEDAYLRDFTLSDAIGEACAGQMDNSVHIALGKKILASITVGGKTILLKDSFGSEIEAMYASAADTPEDVFSNAAFVQWLGTLISMLCLLFPVEVVLISGVPEGTDSFLDRVRTSINLPESKKPQLTRIISPGTSSVIPVMAKKIREKLISGTL